MIEEIHRKIGFLYSDKSEENIKQIKLLQNIIVEKEEEIKRQKGDTIDLRVKNRVAEE